MNMLTREMESEKSQDSEKKARRSSILKPQKPRNPFSTLDFTEPNPDNTLNRAARRVSFASSNLVKPFVADPEKNTIWDATYEEEVNHTDSTKSSYEQTHETKSNNDILNSTSIYFSEDDELLERSNEESHKMCETNFTESVIYGKENIKPELGHKNNENIFDERKLRIALKTPNEFIDKENNHIHGVKNSKCNMNHPFDKETVKMGIFNTSPIGTGNELSKTGLLDTPDIFTKNIEKASTRIDSFTSKRKTIYFVNSDDDMEFTTTLPINNIIMGPNNFIANRTRHETNSTQNVLLKRDGTVHSNKEDNTEIDINVSALESLKDNTQMESEMQLTLPVASSLMENDNSKINNVIPPPQSFAENTHVLTKNCTVYDSVEISVTQTDIVGQSQKSVLNDEHSSKLKRITTNLTQSKADMDITLEIDFVKEKQFIYIDSDTAGLKENYMKDVLLAKENFQNISCVQHLSEFSPIPPALLKEGNVHSITEQNQTVKMDSYSKKDAIDFEKLNISPSKENLENVPHTFKNHGNEFISRTSSIQHAICKRNKNNSIGGNICNQMAKSDNKKDVLLQKSVNNSYIASKILEEKIENENTYDADSKISNINDPNRSTTTDNIKTHSSNSDELIKNKNYKTASDNDKGIKRLSNSDISNDIAIKKIYLVDKNEKNTLTINKMDYDNSMVGTETEILPCNKENLVDDMVHLKKTDKNSFDTKNDSKDMKVSLQNSTISNNNILYSEPMKIKLKTHNLEPIPDLCDNLNLQSWNSSINLKLDHATPTTSFITLTDMSPCIEDTQQLIYATFSKSEKEENIQYVENVSLFNGSVGKDFNNEIKSSNDKTEFLTYIVNEQTDMVEPQLELVLPPESKNDSIGKVNVFFSSVIDKPEEEISYIGDISVDLAPKEFDDSLENSPKTNRSSDNDYTIRSQQVLSRVTEYLEHYQIDSDENHKQKLIAITKQFNKNCSIIGELVSKFRTAKIKIDDLEEKHKQDLEEIYNSISEVTPDDEKSMQMMAGLSAPKSLYDRICEAADRCKKHWKLQTMENDYYCFFTLFGALPFRVHVHPNLGLVYEVKTYTNLDADSRPVAWYGLKLFQHKLKEDNLLSVLGVKYDILTLLDYVNMTMEEIKNFRQEYISLVKKYGTSHHFRMNKDLSISFEVMNVNLIIHWVFTINMSPTEPISKDSIKVCCRVGEKVNEDDIKCIAENTPKGTKFIRNFIENVDDYMKRIERKLKSKRGPY